MLIGGEIIVLSQCEYKIVGNKYTPDSFDCDFMMLL